MSMPPIALGPSLVEPPALERPMRRRWWRSPAVLMGMVVPAVVVPGWLLADPSEPADGVHLPETIVGYLPLTDSAEEHPAGPVVLYASGSGEIAYMYQDVAVDVTGKGSPTVDIVRTDARPSL